MRSSNSRACATVTPGVRWPIMIPTSTRRLYASSGQAAQPGRRARLVLRLDAEPDRGRPGLLPVRADERIRARLEDERDVVARRRPPDDEVARLRRVGRDRLHVLEERPRPALSGVAEPVRVRRAGPGVTERREAGAVGRERQLARLVKPVDRAELRVVDLRLVRDPPLRVGDDLLAQRQGLRRVPLERRDEARAGNAGAARVPERLLRPAHRGGGERAVLPVSRAWVVRREQLLQRLHIRAGQERVREVQRPHLRRRRGHPRPPLSTAGEPQAVGNLTWSRMRVALVTPFAWSQPHDVNEHVDGLARELRRRGHEVTVLAPSNTGRDLAQGRRVLVSDNLSLGDFVALGPAVPISRRSRMGVPVGVRASLSLALARGQFDVVHGFEPGLPSLSYLALRDASALTAATYFSPERLSYPPGRAPRERLLGRIDALLAATPEVAEAAAARFPGRYELVPQGIDPELFAPARKRQLVVLEWRQAERPLLRALERELEQHPGWELVLLRTRTPSSRPAVPRRLRGRMRVRTARSGAARAELLRHAALFVPALDGLPRLLAEAQTAGAAIAVPPGRAEQPELAAAETGRLIEDEAFRARRAEER